ncbi:WGxxGxxG-CTERM domain-containing protein [Paenibacillus senegalensis]|uniref:WGxxGxxG-CTERM domain-containing protein n=1 Tax=Paenibacillus senegalensis TaxID=1465766 RepID=UPI00028A126E|nr:WGxxGxxG-CTERM domain-containing protein [Paenibacillus senegalensis]
MKKWTLSCLAAIALVMFSFTANAQQPAASPTVQNGNNATLQSPAVHDNRGTMMNDNLRTNNMNQVTPNAGNNRNDGRATTAGRADTGFNYRANAANNNDNWSWLGLLGLVGLAGLMGRNRNSEPEK